MFRFFRRNKQPKRDQNTASQTEQASGRLVIEAGRRRVADAPYLLPADFDETNRLDMQHFMLRTAFHGDVMAPVTAPQAILDVGCGTGRWAREQAMQFRQANVIGFDLVEPQADVIARQIDALGSIPANYVFVQGNALQGLPFHDGNFDYAHMRFLALAIPEAQWMRVVSEMTRVTKSGGWVELVEFNTPVGGGPAFQRIIQLWNQLGDTFKMDGRNADHVAQRLQMAGLTRIEEKRVAVNTADRSDRAARMAAVDLDSGIESSGPALIKLGLVAPEELTALRMAAREEYAQPAYNVQWQFCAAFGQKV